jgi:hypothetical protein
MPKKVTVAEPAVRVKKSKRVIEAPSKAWSHTQVESKNRVKKKDVQEGFVDSEGDFIGRKAAAKLARDVGEIKDKHIKKLHSEDLRKALKIKKTKSV